MRRIKIPTVSQSLGKRNIIIYSIILIIILISILSSYNFVQRWWLRENATIAIEEVQPLLNQDGRYFRVRIKTTGRSSIDFSSLHINGTKISTLLIPNSHLIPGEATYIYAQYYWLPNRNYVLKVTTSYDSSDQKSIVTPIFSTDIKFNITSIYKTYLYDDQTGPFKLQFSYVGNITGFSWIKMLIFVQNSYKNFERPIYAFYDPLYVPFETLKKINSLVTEMEKYHIQINKIDWNGMTDIIKNRPPIILILPNPLLNASGEKIFNSSPSCLLDPDEDGLIAEHSIYHRSIPYDWERNEGLVLVSYGSDQAPTSYIVAKNGTSYRRLDLFNLANEYILTDIPVPSFAGWGQSDIALTRIGQSLGLNSWLSYWFQVEDRIAESVDYYVYGYGVSRHAAEFNENWIQPVFIRVGTGGWLSYGLAKQSDENFARNLFLIILHSPWNNVWLGSKAWQYDSGSTFYLTNGGIFQVEDKISTGWIRSLNSTSINIRSIIIAYDADENQHLVLEKIINYSP